MKVLPRSGPWFSMALPRCKNRPRSGVDICLPAVGAAPRALCTDLKSPKSIVLMTLAEALINAPEFTVSELSSALRRTVEDAYGHVRVRGEISGFRGPHSSGHCYFALKDDSAKIEAVMALMEERKRKLSAEGLFDEARKQLLPWLPAVIGVITSPTGAVIRDILHRLADRFPRRVLVWPVKVQGEGSAEQVAAAIRGLDR